MLVVPVFNHANSIIYWPDTTEENTCTNALQIGVTYVYNGHEIYTLVLIHHNLIHLFQKSADIVNTRVCGQCTSVWSRYECVVNVRVSDQCTSVWSLYECLLNARVCGQCTSVWSMHEYVVIVRVCGKCTSMWSMYECVVNARVSCQYTSA